MSVPDYQSIMLPLLELAKDGEIHTLREAIAHVASCFELTAEDRRQLLPSGSQATLDNRVSWARTYLSKAGLLEKAGRARFRITDRGKEVLQRHPPRIDNDLLMEFPEFVDFKNHRASGDATPATAKVSDETETPEALLEASYMELRTTLAEELLERVRNNDPSFFEQLVVDLLVAMGYGGSRVDAGKAVGGTGDGGIDGIIKEDRLGLDTVCIQAKRWQNPVGDAVVRTFAGSLEGHRARKGVLITTSTFYPKARDYVKHIEKKIVLIDGQELAQLMIDHNIGVTETAKYVLKQVDSDYFGE